MRLVLYVMIGFTFLVGCSGETDVPANSDATIPSRDSSASQESVDTPEMHAYPSPESWEHANDRQRKRALRSFVKLKERNVPVYPGPLFVDDDEEVNLHSPQAVARRVLVLWAVELRAEGMPQKEAIELIEGLNLWDSVSPEEKRFLEDDDPDPAESQELVWRLESIWVLLWALGYVEELNWPSGTCDVPKLVKILKPHESDPAFITDAKLRSKSEILDAQDLIMRIHWAIRDAHLNHGGVIPDDLDWSQDYNAVSVTMSAAVRVVEQRHYTLNWLVNFLKPTNWDHVDTPT